ncbi:MAG: class I SAM-dependent methyltransferase [candidate division KSB1 bacterium]|nr:class I SAM-dependent methyltransferase [candidate division KSB1 bacterium]MDZ7304237.1 class I SAM-dependent methyltransferase [candidate division KSB1 bacterium]MDZ7311712.1 class I SAM-dependent methyltransferase [candidate division KSB1 bacterium]
MDEHVCPWWFAYTFDHRFRRLIHQPEKMLNGLVRDGHTVIDIGCGMGFFAIAMAKMVGESGRVIAVDLQAKILEVLQRRARKSGVLSRIHLHQCEQDRLGISEPVDFALAFWMVHEVPDTKNLLRQVRALLKPKAHFLVVEPKIHVPHARFKQIVDSACEVGLKIDSEPQVAMSRAVVFKTS